MKGLTYDDIYLIPRYNGIPSRRDVDTSVTICGETFTLPVISSPMDTITETEMAVKMADMGGLGLIHRFNTIEEQKALYEACRGKRAGIAFGAGEDWKDRVEALYNAGCRIFCLDVAHGHSNLAGTVCKEFKNKYTDTILIAGSVCTHEGALYLESCGADIIRAGCSNGSVCSTNLKTAFGIPSITTIIDCSKISIPVIADGGIRTPGDMVKAFAAGASMVMIGGMLAGTLETPGDSVDGYKTYRGMASREAYEDHFEQELPEWKTAEGVSKSVKMKGSADIVLKDMIGGWRSALTYNGSLDMRDFHNTVKWGIRTHAGAIESTPHFSS